MSATPARRRFSIDEYYCLGEAGVLRPEERTELIAGEVMSMPAVGPGHAEGGSKVERAFHRRVGDDVVVRSRYPIRLPDNTEPQPDIALVRRRPEGYKAAHPRPEDILLVIEVADSSLTYDRDTKLPLYAAAGIAEAWLMNLPADRIEVHRDPSPAGYRSVTLVGRDGTLTPLAFPELVVPSAELLP